MYIKKLFESLKNDYNAILEEFKLKEDDLQFEDPTGTENLLTDVCLPMSAVFGNIIATSAIISAIPFIALDATVACYKDTSEYHLSGNTQESSH